MVTTFGWFPIILEGDSQLILQMTTKLLHGKPMNKVVDNWRMAHSLEHLRELLCGHSEVHTHHVKRKANRLVNLLANHGVEQQHELQQELWEAQIEESLRQKSKMVVEQDQLSPRCG